MSLRVPVNEAPRPIVLPSRPLHRLQSIEVSPRSLVTVAGRREE